MSDIAKNILTLNHEKAMNFFMKSEQYHGFENGETPYAKRTITGFVFQELCKQHNSEYYQIWLQNMLYTLDKKQGTSLYTLRHCQFVADNDDIPLWNNSRLKAELMTNIPYNSVVDGERLKKETPVTTFISIVI